MPRMSSHRSGYDGDWWRLRHYHLKANPLCEFCKKQGRLTRATIVDHIVPFRNNPSLRLDPNNLQSLCKTCHDGAKQKQDNLGLDVGCDLDGIPLRGWD